MFEKMENFDSAVKFLLLKALFYTLTSLRISNWKIISRKIKQLYHLLKKWEFLHGLDICKSSYLSGQYAGSSSIFLQIKTLVDIERSSCYANGSVSASSKISFHGLPSKSKRPTVRKHSVVVIITVNSISFYETAICREIFKKCFFANIFVNF